MLCILIVVSILSVGVSQNSPDCECPSIRKEFSLRGFSTYRGFRPADTLRCKIDIVECANGSLSLGTQNCYMGPLSRTRDFEGTDGIVVGFVMVFFSLQENQGMSNSYGLPETFYANIYMNMDEVKVIRTFPGSVAPDQLNRYLAEVVALLPNLINKDPEFQMMFENREGKLVAADEISFARDYDVMQPNI